MQISITSIKDRQGAALPFEFQIAPQQFGPLPPGVELVQAVDVRGSVTNTGSSMLVRATAVADVRLECSRCLRDVDARVKAQIEERYRRAGAEDSFEEDPLAEEDDVGYYERDRIDVGEVVRENFALEIPMKPVCDDGCKGLCPLCGIDLNVDSCSCRHDDTDPRLAVLREWKARQRPSD